MKNLLLLISILLGAFGCNSPKTEPQNLPPIQLAQLDSLPPLQKDSDTVAIAVSMEKDPVFEDEISPELWRKYREVKSKMISQQPPVRTVGDGFKYNLTKEEWSIYNKVQNHMLKESREFQSKRENTPK